MFKISRGETPSSTGEGTPTPASPSPSKQQHKSFRKMMKKSLSKAMETVHQKAIGQTKEQIQAAAIAAQAAAADAAAALGPLDDPWVLCAMGEVAMVTMGTLDEFMHKSDRPKVLLFTQCTQPSPLFAQAASVFHGRLDFGEGDAEVAHKFDVLPEYMPRVIVIQSSSKAPPIRLDGSADTSFAELTFFLAAQCPLPPPKPTTAEGRRWKKHWGGANGNNNNGGDDCSNGGGGGEGEGSGNSENNNDDSNNNQTSTTNSSKDAAATSLESATDRVDPYANGLVARVTSQNLREFLGDPDVVSRVLLFSANDESTLLSELGWVFRGVYAFGNVLLTEVGVMESFNVQPKQLPHLHILGGADEWFVHSGQSGMKREPITYLGPLQFYPLALFLASPRAMFLEMKEMLSRPDGDALLARWDPKEGEGGHSGWYNTLGRRMFEKISRGPAAAIRDRQFRSREARLANAAQRWTEEIIPRFQELKGEEWVRELWLEGLPAKIRGTVWLAQIGNDAGITKIIFESFLVKAEALRVEFVKVQQEEHSRRRSRVVKLEEEEAEKAAAVVNSNGEKSISCSSSIGENGNTNSSSSSELEKGEGEEEVEKKEKPNEQVPLHRSASDSAAVLSNTTSSSSSSTENHHDDEKSKTTENESQEEAKKFGRSLSSPIASSSSANHTSFLSTLSPGEISRFGQEYQQIGMDLQRTFPLLGFFSKGGDLHNLLRDVLEAYSLFRPSIGYVQGMSHIAAVFLLFLEPYEAFCCLVNLLDRHHFADFFCMKMDRIHQHLSTFDILLQQLLPALSAHLSSLQIESRMFLIEWFLTIFTSALDLDVATRVVDCFILDGLVFLFRAALGVMRVLQPRLLGSNYEQCLEILTHLSKVQIREKDLFAAIETMNVEAASIMGLLAVAG